ncbi:MAG: aminotransferase class I/II-fold pyridoxal phosphate-dependent enzyme [Thiovulaceae bacterium]|nr:aminotransferase class I/II-fold pyridoxal phosphate-dependent enzyme [Sulfurimonadaceae bacterium]
MYQNTHGGDILQAATLLGCKPEQIIDFSSNINFISPKVKRNISKKALTQYATPDYASLKSALCKTYELPTEQIALFNGASSAIFELLRLLAPKDLFLYAPLYSEYKKAASYFAQNTYLINRFDDLLQQPTRNSTIIFVNPSTPDGTYYDLEKLFPLWEAQNCTVIIDESFLAFSQGTSIRNKLLSYDKLYIIQSMTKFYACAGVRIGAIFSQKKNIDMFILPAWNLSTFDVEFLEGAVNDNKHVTKSKQKNHENFDTLLAMLEKASFTKKVYSSHANFILVQTNIPAYILAQQFLDHKILVRDCSNFDFLGNDHLRFAVKDKKALKKLKKAIDALT